MVVSIGGVLSMLSGLSMVKLVTPNNSVERDRLQAALIGSLRGFAATAAPHVKRWAYSRFLPAIQGGHIE